MDGGFGGLPNTPSNSDFSAWVALALAAADINPKIQRQPGGTDLYSYLLANANELTYTTDFERVLMVVNAAGASPHDFSGVDLVAKILEREIQEPAVGGIAFPHEAGSQRAGMNDTIFAVLALVPIHEPAVQTIVQEATSWIEDEQNANGSWPSTCPKTVAGCHPFGKEPAGNADMTAAAIEALNAAGHHDTPAQEKALQFLHEAQVSSEGGFAEQPGESEANTGSTCWVLQGIWAAGQNPETWRLGGIDPLTYLERLQQPNGEIPWRRAGDEAEKNAVWMTSYCGPALMGVPLPIPEAPPEPPVLEPYEPETGNGGEDVQNGSGVDAGGGGEGAPLFSRPQRESKGHTPGGARVLASKASRKPIKHRRNPGSPREHPAPTLKQEAAKPPPLRREGGAEGQAAKTTHLSLPPPAAKDAGDLREVTGIPIASFHADALEPGAPGLRGAGAKPASPALAIAIAGLALLLVLSGSAVERHKPQMAP